MFIVACMADEDLKQTITDNAKAPAEAQTDNVRVKQQPLKDVIEADKYLAGKNAAAKNHRGLYFNQIKPPGAA